MPNSERDAKSSKTNAAEESGRISASQRAYLGEMGITEAALRKDRIKQLTIAQRADLLGVSLARRGGPRIPLSMFSLTARRPVHGQSYLQLAACQLFDPRYPTLTGPSPTGDAWFDNKSLSSYALSPSVAVFFHAAGKALVEFHLSLGSNDLQQTTAQFRITWQAGSFKAPPLETSLDAIRGGTPHGLIALCDPQEQAGELPFVAMIEQIDPATGPQIWWRFHSASITKTA